MYCVTRLLSPSLSLSPMLTWRPEITFRKLSPPAAMLYEIARIWHSFLAVKPAACDANSRRQQPLFPLAPANQICMVHFSTRLCLHFAQSNNFQPESMSQGVDRASTRPASENTNKSPSSIKKFHGNDLCTWPEPVPFDCINIFASHDAHWLPLWSIFFSDKSNYWLRTHRACALPWLKPMGAGGMLLAAFEGCPEKLARHI